MILIPGNVVHFDVTWTAGFTGEVREDYPLINALGWALVSAMTKWILVCNDAHGFGEKALQERRRAGVKSR